MFRFNIRTKLIILLLVFGLLPVLAVMPIIFNKLEEMKELRLGEMHTVANSVNKLIDNNLMERYGDVQAFAVNNAARDVYNWYNKESYLVSAMNSYIKNYRIYKMMMLVDMEGKVAAVNTINNGGKELSVSTIYDRNFSDAAWFKKSVNKEFSKGNGADGTVVEQANFEKLVSDVYDGEDGYVITFSAPVYDHSGKMIGVWVNFVDFSLVEKIVAATYESEKKKGNAGTEIQIIDKEGNIIVDYDPGNFKSDKYVRQAEIIGKFNLATRGVEAAQEAVKGNSGAMLSVNVRKKIEQAVGYSHSKGVDDYPGLGWSALVRIPSSEVFADINSTKDILYVIIAVTAAIVAAIGLFIGNIASKPLRKSTDVTKALADGDYSLDIQDSGNSDEIGQLTRGMIELRKSVEKSVLQQSMLDNLSTPVMLCDKEYNITYANKSTLESLKKVEKFLPISINEVVGANIDIFHKNPAHQRKLLADNSKLPHRAKFPIGDQWLSLNANALPSRDGSFQGAFVDWMVITDEVRNEESVKLAQEKINELISFATKGDLSKRINAEQFDGFYKELAVSMNQLMDTIVEPINKAIMVLGELSTGNLTVKMEGDYEGSFAAIRDALDSTITKLYDMVRQIIESAQSVNSAASEIASGSTDLSQRTEEQASSLEETAASMEEITGTVKQNSNNAIEANGLSEKANKVAGEGGKVVEEAVCAMSSIEQSSQKISDIIGVIDEIAFQTNLLALNAAVEAARAGDAGKGFAVVASEVRSLAGRSASASKEIKALINESEQQVKNGAVLVNQAGDTLKGIVESVRQVSGIVSEIASASKEQATGIDEINTAITQMDEVTQQNAALVEENTAAAQSMVDQAHQLEKLMSFFRLDDSVGNEKEAMDFSDKKPKLAAVNNQVKKRVAPPMDDKKVAKISSSKAVGDDSSYDADWKEF
ncbi:MAG: methyl-accepting chemotaxis protein [Rickettsiales bacterium]